MKRIVALLRRTFVLLLLSLTFMVMKAQTSPYDKLWQQYETAFRSDKPQSQRRVLADIVKQATADDNAAQLLRALLADRLALLDLSTDSMGEATQRIVALHDTAADPVRKAVYSSILGIVYQFRNYRDADTYDAERSQTYLLASLSDMKRLARTPATDYQPLLNEGTDAQVFGNDLLSVLFVAAVEQAGSLTDSQVDSVCTAVAATYDKFHRPDAALFALLKSASRLPHDKEKARLYELLDRYKGTPHCVYAYARLNDLLREEETDTVRRERYRLLTEALDRHAGQRGSETLHNALADLTEPTYTLNADADATYAPGETMKLTIRARNLEKVRLRVDRMDIGMAELAGHTSDVKFVDSHATNIEDRTLSLGLHEPYEDFEYLTELNFAQAGTYRVSLQAKKMTEQYDLVTVSGMRPIVVATNADKRPVCRITPVRLDNGKPIAGGVLKGYLRGNSGRLTLARTFQADSQGHIRLYDDQMRRYDAFFLHTPDEPVGLRVNASTPTYNAPRVRHEVEVCAYTDRSIYRPGQTLHYGIVVYDQHADSLHVLNGRATHVTLYDVNNREVGQQDLTTDSFGVCGGSIDLPAQALPGSYRLEVVVDNHVARTTEYVKVEAYKRPTFRVELTAPETAYMPGDSVVLKGKAVTYVDTPVRQAKVEVDIKTYNGNDEQSDRLTLLTDDEGQFEVTTKLPEPFEPEQTVHAAVRATVTSAGGESQEASRWFYARRPAAVLSLTWPELLCRDDSTCIEIDCLNASGAHQKGEGTIDIMHHGRVVLQRTYTEGQRFVAADVLALPSGVYEARISHPLAATVTQRYRLFGLDDTSVPDTLSEPVLYARPDADAGTAEIVVLMPDQEQYVFVEHHYTQGPSDLDIVSGRNQIMRFGAVWKPTMGDGMRLVVHGVSHGRYFEKRTFISRPSPDQHLQLTWNTFRSRLVPGQQTRWTLDVTHSDGTPADANLMAVLYDATLDQIRDHHWFINMSFPRYLPTVRVPAFGLESLFLTCVQVIKYKDETPFSPTRWNERYIGPYGFYDLRVERRMYKTMGVSGRNAMDEMVFAAAAPEGMAADDGDMLEQKSAAVKAEGNAAPGKESAAAQPLRSNFDETAYFAPALRTDANGHVVLAFQLPESLTTWQFMGFAHDRLMRYGRLNAQAVARQNLMVQPRLPRFLFAGDQSEVAIDVENLADERLEGTLTLEVCDAATLKTLARHEAPFAVDANRQTTLHLPLAAPADCDELIVRCVAQTPQGSDGEEHRLPIRSERVEVENSKAFVLRGGEDLKAQLDTLFRGNGRQHERLLVDVTERPLGAAAEALVLLDHSKPLSATDWVERLYALRVAETLAARHPEIVNQFNADAPAPEATTFAERCEDTPWVRAAEADQQRRQRLASLFDVSLQRSLQQQACDRLLQLQNADGGFAWMPQMKSNAYITSRVALLLTRMPQEPADARLDEALSRARNYMEGWLKERVEWMERHKTSYTTRLDLEILYTLLSQPAYKPSRYDRKLLKLWEPASHSHTMYERAMQAVTQARAGRTGLAAERLESLLEHLVGTPADGLYFDSRRTETEGRSYALPTQTLAIEAIETLRPQAADTVAEMRHWLLLQRRTQLWGTSTATADALHSLLSAPQSTIQPTQGLTGHVSAGEKLLTILPPDTVGTLSGHYSLLLSADRLPSTDHLTLQAHATHHAPQVWLSATAIYTLPASEADAAAEGMRVSQKIEVWRDGKWKETDGTTPLSVGNRVRMSYTLRADSDYDFVRLHAPRPACLEPVSSASGLMWSMGGYFYRAVGDKGADYFFDLFPKGTMTISEEFFVDRAGTFRAAGPTMQCVYAPEYQSRATSMQIHTSH